MLAEAQVLSEGDGEAWPQWSGPAASGGIAAMMLLGIPPQILCIRTNKPTEGRIERNRNSINANCYPIDSDLREIVEEPDAATIGFFPDYLPGDVISVRKGQQNGGANAGQGAGRLYLATFGGKIEHCHFSEGGRHPSNGGNVCRYSFVSSRLHPTAP